VVFPLGCGIRGASGCFVPFGPPFRGPPPSEKNPSGGPPPGSPEPRPGRKVRFGTSKNPGFPREPGSPVGGNPPWPLYPREKFLAPLDGPWGGDPIWPLGTGPGKGVFFFSFKTSLFPSPSSLFRDSGVLSPTHFENFPSHPPFPPLFPFVPPAPPQKERKTWVFSPPATRGGFKNFCGIVQERPKERRAPFPLLTTSPPSPAPPYTVLFNLEWWGFYGTKKTGKGKGAPGPPSPPGQNPEKERLGHPVPPRPPKKAGKVNRFGRGQVFFFQGTPSGKRGGGKVTLFPGPLDNPPKPPRKSFPLFPPCPGPPPPTPQKKPSPPTPSTFFPRQTPPPAPPCPCPPILPPPEEQEKQKLPCMGFPETDVEKSPAVGVFGCCSPPKVLGAKPHFPPPTPKQFRPPLERPGAWARRGPLPPPGENRVFPPPPGKPTVFPDPRPPSWRPTLPQPKPHRPHLSPATAKRAWGNGPPGGHTRRTPPPPVLVALAGEKS